MPVPVFGTGGKRGVKQSRPMLRVIVSLALLSASSRWHRGGSVARVHARIPTADMTRITDGDTRGVGRGDAASCALPSLRRRRRWWRGTLGWVSGAVATDANEQSEPEV